MKTIRFFVEVEFDTKIVDDNEIEYINNQIGESVSDKIRAFGLTTDMNEAVITSISVTEQFTNSNYSENF